MVFIRPTIISSAADAQALTGPRYAYIRDREMGQTGADQSQLDALVRDYMRAEPLTAVPAPALDR